MRVDLSQLDKNVIVVTINDKQYEYIRKPLPKSIFELLIKVRLDSLERAKEKFDESMLTSSSSTALHSPPVVTHGDPDHYPVNVAAKGIGFVPKEEYLSEFVEQFEDLINEAIEKGSDYNKDERLAALVNFYKSPNKINTYVLGTLELYGHNSWRNVQYDPRVAILYNTTKRDEKRGRPEYISFEVKAIAEIIPKSDLRWRWQRNVHDLFHLWNAKERRASNWPVAVLNYHILKTINKRPFPFNLVSKEIME